MASLCGVSRRICRTRAGRDHRSTPCHTLRCNIQAPPCSSFWTAPGPRRARCSAEALTLTHCPCSVLSRIGNRNTSYADPAATITSVPVRWQQFASPWPAKTWLGKRLRLIWTCSRTTTCKPGTSSPLHGKAPLTRDCARLPTCCHHAQMRQVRQTNRGRLRGSVTLLEAAFICVLQQHLGRLYSKSQCNAIVAHYLE